MGKGTMFMMFVWLCVCIAGGVLSGDVQFIQTTLTTAVDADDSTLHLASTAGLPETGIIVVEEEHVAYSHTSDTTVYGTLTAPLTRGAQGTEAVEHAIGVAVTTVPGALINASGAYNIATMADASGIQAFVTAPLAFFRLLGAFFFLPLSFFGTNLAIISYLWMIFGVGMIAALTISLAGGRRV